MTQQEAFSLYTEPGDRYRRVQDAEVGLHHRDAGDTELSAALSVVETSGQQKVDLLKVLVDAGWHGMTDHEAVAKTRLPMSSINSRRNALKRRGWVEDSGRRRESPFHKPVIVWVATPAGRRQSR